MITGEYTMKIRKHLLLMLVTVFVLYSFSCGKVDDVETTNPDAESTVENKVDIDSLDRLKALDFSGYEFNVLTYDNKSWDVYIDPVTETGDTLNDAAYKRNSETEELLNITIKAQKEGLDNYETVFQNCVMSGDGESVDLMVFWSPGQRTRYVTEKLVYDWNNLPYVDLEADYYNKSANNTYTILGRQYFAVSDFTYTVQQHWRILFNKTIASDFGIDSPYDAFFDGNWTIDRMLGDIKGVSADLNSDGKQDLDDRYGMIANSYTVSGLIFGFGDSPVRLNGDQFEFSLNNERFNDEVRKLVEFFDNPDICIYDRDIRKQYTNFYNGKSLYMPYSSDPAALRDIEVDYGYLPYPKFDENQENYVVWAAGGMMAVPATAVDTERTGAIIEALSAISGKYLKDAFIEKYIEGKILRDDESVNVYRMMRENMTYEISYNLDPSEKLTSLEYYRYFITKKSTDTASYWAKNSEKIINSYSDFLASVGQD